MIDVREDNEWSAGHAAGAIHLSKGIIERDIEARVPDKSSTMVLYCGGGFRSALAADNLRKMGTKTRFRSTAAGEPGREPDCRSKNMAFRKGPCRPRKPQPGTPG